MGILGQKDAGDADDMRDIRMEAMWNEVWGHGGYGGHLETWKIKRTFGDIGLRTFGGMGHIEDAWGCGTEDICGREEQRGYLGTLENIENT